MYQGEWKDNIMEGFGIYNFVNGRTYIGEWKENKLHGYGEFTWVEGKKYYGFYKCDKKDGFGIYYWPGEKFLLAFWKDGKQNGAGKFIKGKLVKYGKWKDGKKEKIFNNEDQFFNCLEPNEEKYSVYFQWDINRLKTFMEVE